MNNFYDIDDLEKMIEMDARMKGTLLVAAALQFGNTQPEEVRRKKVSEYFREHFQIAKKEHMAYVDNMNRAESISAHEEGRRAQVLPYKTYLIAPRLSNSKVFSKKK